MSTPDRPKQLQTLFSIRPLVTSAVERAMSIAGAHHTWVVTDARYAEDVRPLVPSVADDHVLLEPSAGGTLGAVTLAAVRVASMDPDAVLVALPADHVLGSEELLEAAIRLLVDELETGEIGLVATPTIEVNPELGHVLPGATRRREGEVTVSVIDRYVEKPASAGALGDGRWLRNMGIVVAHVGLLAQAAGPARWTAACAVGEGAAGSAGLWAAIEAERIEDAVLPRDRPMVVVEADVQWADVGAWTNVFDSVPPDRDGNRLSGAVQALDTTRSVVIAAGLPVAVLGLKDVLVVSTPDRIVVCARSHLPLLAEVSGAR